MSEDSNLTSVSLTVESGPTDKPAEWIIAIPSRQLLQCSRFFTQKKAFQKYIWNRNLNTYHINKYNASVQNFKISWKHP